MKLLKLFVVLITLSACTTQSEQAVYSVPLDKYSNQWISDEYTIDKCQFDSSNIIGAWIEKDGVSSEMYTQYFLDNGIWVMYGKNLLSEANSYFYPYRLGNYFFSNCELIKVKQRSLYYAEPVYITSFSSINKLSDTELVINETVKYTRIIPTINDKLNGQWTIPEKNLEFVIDMNENELIIQGENYDIISIQQLSDDVIYIKSSLFSEVGLYRFEFYQDWLYLYPLYRDNPDEGFIKLSRSDLKD
ncbi:hypothetical protein [Holdemania massiliensis]|uniref:hypothetical protein n=1 Tax=Holdemania massiliensis TaxID=1468449 RepID=UPI001F05E569|nr:hypothetical protein [Holdemania massiliensis]MCH1942470.1 hypothetical protein [Holdemania massiliensis]